MDKNTTQCYKNSGTIYIHHTSKVSKPIEEDGSFPKYLPIIFLLFCTDNFWLCISQRKKVSETFTTLLKS